MPRFAGLDRLRGLALALMLVHHAVAWTSGGSHARRLLGFDDRMAVTDLAAPLFALAAGAAAFLVGSRLRSAPAADRWRVGRRWAAIGAWGVAIGMAVDGQVDAFGVLEVLAVVGAIVTLVAVAVSPPPGGWLVLAVAATIGAPAVLEDWSPDDGAVGVVLGGGFPVVTYLAFAAWGATAVALQGRDERAERILAMAVVAVAAVVATGSWRPERHPGGLLFVLPGVAAALLAWAALALVPTGWASDALARAGRRTLGIFVTHYLVRIVLHEGGWTGHLQGPGWTITALVVAAAFFAVAARPARAPAHGLDRERSGNRDATAGPVLSRR